MHKLPFSCLFCTTKLKEARRVCKKCMVSNHVDRFNNDPDEKAKFMVSERKRGADRRKSNLITHGATASPAQQKTKAQSASRHAKTSKTKRKLWMTAKETLGRTLTEEEVNTLKEARGVDLLRSAGQFKAHAVAKERLRTEVKELEAGNRHALPLLAQDSVTCHNRQVSGGNTVWLRIQNDPTEYVPPLVCVWVCGTG